MVDIINLLLLIIGCVLVVKLIKYLRKRIVLIFRLIRLTKEYDGKLKFTRFPLLPTCTNTQKPDAYVKILDTVYLIRLYSGGGKHFMIHFASEKFSVRYIKMALRMLASTRRRGTGIAYVESGKAFTARAKVFISKPMEAPENLVGDAKRVEKILLFNPAPHGVSYVSSTRTNIKLALTGDELYGMKIFTGSSFVAYAAKQSQKDDL
jgi:hypothetical protein